VESKERFTLPQNLDGGYLNSKKQRYTNAPRHKRSGCAAMECPASFVPVELIQTGKKGALYGTREEA
jgi:hypothetical protein